MILNVLIMLSTIVWRQYIILYIITHVGINIIVILKETVVRLRGHIILSHAFSYWQLHASGCDCTMAGLVVGRTDTTEYGL